MICIGQFWLLSTEIRLSFVAARFVPTLQQTIYRTGVYRKALCQFLYADALIVSFQNQLSSFIVQHSSHLLCLCYTSFCSKVKVLCCIIENCYRIMRYCLYNFTSISPAPESDCPSPLSPNRAYRSSSSAPPPQNKRHVPPYLYHKVGTCRYIIMILSRQSHQAMQPSAKLLRLAFSFCWLRLAMISLLRPIRLVLKWKNGRSGTVKISTGRM